jgi:uncharacterized protein
VTLSLVLAVLSPAKKLNFEPETQSGLRSTTPELLKETHLLAETTRKLAPAQIKKMMKLSDDLAELNFQRFQSFDSKATRPRGSKQAVLAFAGDTYVGLRAAEFELEEMTFAQEHLGILSGLYGFLRPLDAIQPYRLEMGTRFPHPRGNSLYEFWGDRVSRKINARLKALKSDTLINLASHEYFSVVQPNEVKGVVITPVFKEKRNGALKIISFCAKRARGSMARYMIQKRSTDPSVLQTFREDGYRFDKSKSTETEWLFVRDAR